MGKETAKGTRFERYLAEELLPQVWPDVERAAKSGINDFGDFTNVGGWLVEANHRKRWAVPDYIRGILEKIKRRGQPTPWVLVLRQDKRTLPVDVAVLDAKTFFRILAVVRVLTEKHGAEAQDE